MPKHRATVGSYRVGVSNERGMSEAPLYTSSGEGAIFDPEDVLGRSWGPVAGHMSLLATQGIVEVMPPEEDSSYRATSLIRNNLPLGLCSGTVPRTLRWS